MKLLIDNVSKTFSNNNETKKVLKDMNLSVKEGEFVTLLGPSGCGKTTMLTIIAGFQSPDKGKVELDGVAIKGPGVDRAFMFQNYALFPWMSIKNNILFPMKQLKYSKEQMNERFEYLMDISKLRGNEDLYPHQISGGMKQRTALVRALATKPKLLLMDEPLGALDMMMRQDLQREIEDILLKEKMTIIMVSHDIDEAIYLSDRVVVMSTNSGKVVIDLSIDMKRPRNRKSEQYKEYERILIEHISGSLEV